MSVRDQFSLYPCLQSPGKTEHFCLQDPGVVDGVPAGVLPAPVTTSRLKQHVLLRTTFTEDYFHQGLLSPRTTFTEDYFHRGLLSPTVKPDKLQLFKSQKSECSCQRGENTAVARKRQSVQVWGNGCTRHLLTQLEGFSGGTTDKAHTKATTPYRRRSSNAVAARQHCSSGTTRFLRR